MSAAYFTLISAAELAQHIDDSDWVIFDCRFDLSQRDRGRLAYAQAHLPRAFYADLERDLSAPTNGRNGRHPLPDPDRLAAMLGSCGVGKHSQVVAYDDAGGMFAARLWWLLRWLGHARVAVLDGGLQAGVAAGLALTDAVPTAAAQLCTPSVHACTVDADYLLARLGSAELKLIDARSADRFRGENEVLDPVGGHIPGALNRFFRDNLDASGRFKDAAVLRAEFHQLLGDALPQQVVHQCGSGVSACMNLLAMEVAGRPGSALYPGSWSEWCADPRRPLATGPA